MKMKLKINTSYFYILPALIFLASISFYPLIRTIYLSFTKYDLSLGAKNPEFIGLKNYLTLISDENFITSLQATIILTFTTVTAECAIGLIMALVLNENFRGRGALRTLLLLPWGIPAVVEGQMWRYLFNDQFGAVNDLLYRLGIISSYKAWLAEPNTAILAIIVAETWATSIFVGLILLGGLQSIPEELYDAAKVDGAGRWRRFISVTLPLLKAPFVVALVFRTNQAFFMFDVVYVMTGGGPGGSTRTLAVYAYDTYFYYLNFGYGATLAVIHFTLGLIIALIYLRIMRIRLE